MNETSSRILIFLFCACALLAPVAAQDANLTDKMLAKLGVEGEIFMNCDDQFDAYLNDAPLFREGTGGKPRMVQAHLKAGDLLKVKAVNGRGARGFAFVFLSKKSHVTFSSRVEQWQSYRPADVMAWWKTSDVEARLDSLPISTRANNQDWKRAIERASGVPCFESIWGEPGAKTVYLIKKVSEKDLIPASRW